jgi:CheY-like chemotaxis protein
LDRFQQQTAAVKALGEHFDILWAHTDAEAERLVETEACAGRELPARRHAVDVLDSQRLLDRLPSGVAIVCDDLRIRWHNRAFMQLAGGRVQVGNHIYEALGCDDGGPSGSPFADCRSGTEQATARLRLRSDRHVEITVQVIPEFGQRGAISMLCLVHDVTSEVRQREKLVAIHRAGIELSHLTPNELATMSTAERIELLKANIVQYSQSILNFKNLEIRLLEPRSKRLTVLLAVGMIAPAVERELYAELTGNGVTGYVAATATSYRCDDTLNDPLYIPGAADARSSLTVPIFYRGSIIGTFNVESPVPRHFTESDREFLEVFASEIAVALNTLQLLQAEKEFGGSATVEEILTKVSLPADEIVADASRLLDVLGPASTFSEPARASARRMLSNAEVIKNSIQQVGQALRPRDELSATAEPLATRLAGRRVLVVDADPAIRLSAHRLLGRVGCMVDTARDAREALTLARSIAYDVVLSDIRLPDVNGFEFYCQMRQQCGSTSIALMTGFGYDASHSLVRARQAGLRVVLYKPFRFDRLCEAIRDALDAGVGQTSEAVLVATATADPAI